MERMDQRILTFFSQWTQISIQMSLTKAKSTPDAKTLYIIRQDNTHYTHRERERERDKTKSMLFFELFFFIEKKILMFKYFSIMPNYSA